MDPFILSGIKSLRGIGTFLVTATGVSSSYGKTMMSLDERPDNSAVGTVGGASPSWLVTVYCPGY